MATSSVRRRKKKNAKEPAPVTEPPISVTPSEALVKDLHEIWSKAREGGVSSSEYSACLQRALGHEQDTKPQRPRRRRGLCCCLFDCVWTLVLFLIACSLLIAYWEPASFFIQSHFHGAAYGVNRVARFAFLRTSPYLESLGLDLTRPCSCSNPFVNETNMCPCIDWNRVEEVGVVREGDRVQLPDIVLSNRHRVFLIKGVLSIEEQYGRESLVEYTARYGSLPNPCMQMVDDPTGQGPSTPYDVVRDDVWERLTVQREPWDVTWHECKLKQDGRRSLRVMLPELSFLPEGTIVDNSSIFSLASQYGRGNTYVANDILKYDSILLVLLAGNVTVQMFSDHKCFDYCSPQERYYPMTAGDALIMDRKYWACQTRTWSENSFIMTTTFNYNQSHDRQ